MSLNLLMIWLTAFDGVCSQSSVFTCADYQFTVTYTSWETFYVTANASIISNSIHTAERTNSNGFDEGRLGGSRTTSPSLNITSTESSIPSLSTSTSAPTTSVILIQTSSSNSNTTITTTTSTSTSISSQGFTDIGSLVSTTYATSVSLATTSTSIPTSGLGITSATSSESFPIPSSHTSSSSPTSSIVNDSTTTTTTTLESIITTTLELVPTTTPSFSSTVTSSELTTSTTLTSTTIVSTVTSSSPTTTIATSTSSSTTSETTTTRDCTPRTVTEPLAKRGTVMMVTTRTIYPDGCVVPTTSTTTTSGPATTTTTTVPTTTATTTVAAAPVETCAVPGCHNDVEFITTTRDQTLEGCRASCLTVPGCKSFLVGDGVERVCNLHGAPANEIIAEQFTANNPAFCSHFKSYNIECDAPPRGSPIYDGGFEMVTYNADPAANQFIANGWDLGWNNNLRHASFAATGDMPRDSFYSAQQGGQFVVFAGDPGNTAVIKQHLVVDPGFQSGTPVLVFSVNTYFSSNLADFDSCELRAFYESNIVLQNTFTKNDQAGVWRSLSGAVPYSLVAGELKIELDCSNLQQPGGYIDILLDSFSLFVFLA